MRLKATIPLFWAIALGVQAPRGAMAADLGADCCADLEARIAEIEETSARKGTRKVKLTVSGHVNEAMLFWDDGFEGNTYLVTNETSRSRFRFVGEAKIKDDWSAGFLFEIGVRSVRENRVDQNNDDAGSGLDVRHIAWWIGSKTYGKLTIGQTSEATDDITQINLANVRHIATNRLGQWIGSDRGGFFLRLPDGRLSTLRWGQIVGQNNGSNATPGEGDRFNVVRYDSPTFAGFTASANWGEDDLWSVALRYAGDFAGLKVNGGVGYNQSTEADSRCSRAPGAEDDCNSIGASMGVMHEKSGLYVHAAYGRKQDDQRDELYAQDVEDEDEFYYLQAGIEQKWTELGKTTLWGEYRHDDVGANAQRTSFADIGGAGARMAGAEIAFWGLGLNQSIENASMDLYLAYRHFSADVFTSATGVKSGSATIEIEDFDQVLAGALIKF